MTTVQSVGANDYPVQMQEMTEQTPEEIQEVAVIDPDMEEKKDAAKKQKGMVALGVLGLAGIGLGCIKWRSASKLGKEVERLESENTDILKKLKEKKESLNKEYTLGTWKRFVRFFNPKAYMTDAEKVARQEAKEAKKAAKKAGKKIDDNVKKAGDEA